MRFAFIEEHRNDLPVNRLCDIMDVSPRGYRAWRSRPMSVSQRKDLVILAHIRDQFKQSLGSYGRPRMTEELKELGLAVGYRRVGRLMKERAFVRHWSEDNGERDKGQAEQEVQGDYGQQPQLKASDFLI